MHRRGLVDVVLRARVISAFVKSRIFHSALAKLPGLPAILSALSCTFESAFECSVRMATTLPLPKIPFLPAITVQPSRRRKKCSRKQERIVIRNLEMKSTKHESNLNFSTGYGRLHNYVVGQKDKKAFEIEKS